MSGFVADLDALDGLIARLVAFERQAEASTAEVDRQVARLHGEWTGWAASEHLAAHRRWVEGAARMRSAVESLHSVVATAHGNYCSAAATNVRMWG